MNPVGQNLPPELRSLIQSEPSAPLAPDGLLLDHTTPIESLYSPDSNSNPDNRMNNPHRGQLSDYGDPHSVNAVHYQNPSA